MVTALVEAFQTVPASRSRQKRLSFCRLWYLIAALMKPSWLTPAMLRNFQKMQGMGVAVLVLALIPWLADDFIASLAATQMTTHTTLRTTHEKDDARLTRAF